jgi:hypothetical protein
MATAGRAASSPAPASDAAGRLREAAFVRFAVRADGDALAATGLLATGCVAAGVPFQARVVRGWESRRPAAADDATAVGVGTDAPAADLTIPSERGPARRHAFETARELGAEPDPILALAGAFAATDSTAVVESVAGDVLAAARERGLVERRPGVAAPVADATDGLAHTTLAHAPFSGEADAARAAVEGIDADGDGSNRADERSDEHYRRVGSLLALSVAGSESTPRAAAAVERALRPHAIADGEPFATVGGYADVLGALARDAPGVGLALALGSDAERAALDAWRDHAGRAHAAIRAATTARYDGLFVARLPAAAPVATAARLLRDFRSPEPVVLTVTEERAAAAACTEAAVGESMTVAASARDGTGSGDDRRGEACFEGSGDEFVAAFREAR